MNHKAEMARLKHKYRRLIMTGKLRLAPKDAAPLIGPDVAYHLYRTMPSRPSKKDNESNQEA